MTFQSRHSPALLDDGVIVQINDMTTSDLFGVMSIEESAYEFPWSLKIFEDCLAAGYQCLTARIDHTLAGYAIQSVAAGEAHILNICVSHRFRQRGLAKQILNELIARAHQQNAATIFLEVRPTNHAALKLYAKLGFQQIGVRKNYYPHKNGREDAIVLSLGI